jgi:hypothetical protein
MVLQRKSLPQAVPSSICISHVLVHCPPKSSLTSSQGLPSESSMGVSSLGHENGSGIRGTYVVARDCEGLLLENCLVYYLCWCGTYSGGLRSWKAWSSTGTVSDCLSSLIRTRQRTSSSLFLRGGVLPAMMTCELLERAHQISGVATYELSLARSQALQGRLVAESDLARLHHESQTAVDGVGGLLSFLWCHLCAQEICFVVPVGVGALR